MTRLRNADEVDGMGPGWNETLGCWRTESCIPGEYTDQSHDTDTAASIARLCLHVIHGVKSPERTRVASLLLAIIVSFVANIAVAQVGNAPSPDQLNQLLLPVDTENQNGSWLKRRSSTIAIDLHGRDLTSTATSTGFYPLRILQDEAHLLSIETGITFLLLPRHRSARWRPQSASVELHTFHRGEPKLRAPPRSTAEDVRQFRLAIDGGLATIESSNGYIARSTCDIFYSYSLMLQEQLLRQTPRELTSLDDYKPLLNPGDTTVAGRHRCFTEFELYEFRSVLGFKNSDVAYSGLCPHPPISRASLNMYECMNTYFKTRLRSMFSACLLAIAGISETTLTNSRAINQVRGCDRSTAANKLALRRRLVEELSRSDFDYYKLAQASFAWTASAMHRNSCFTEGKPDRTRVNRAADYVFGPTRDQGVFAQRRAKRLDYSESWSCNGLRLR